MFGEKLIKSAAAASALVAAGSLMLGACGGSEKSKSSHQSVPQECEQKMDKFWGPISDSLDVASLALALGVDTQDIYNGVEGVVHCQKKISFEAVASGWLNEDIIAVNGVSRHCLVIGPEDLSAPAKDFNDALTVCAQTLAIEA